MIASLEDIVYLHDLAQNEHLSVAGFNPQIPLPLYSEHGEAVKHHAISIENILTGLITVCIHEPYHPHIDYYRQLACAIHPNIKKELSSTARVKAQNGDFSSADEIFTVLLALFPQDEGILLNKALMLEEWMYFFMQSGLTDDGDALQDQIKQMYQQLLQSDSPKAEIFFNAGFFYLSNKDYGKAQSLLSVALSLFPDTEAGSVQKKKAQDALFHIQSQGLDNPLLHKAIKALESHHEEKACELLRMFLEHVPKSLQGWFLLGWTLRRLARYDDALTVFTHCETLTSEQTDEHFLADMYNEKALCLMADPQNYPLAQQCLHTALSYSPENTHIITNLGVVALKQGKHRDAERFFLTALSLNPHDSIAKSWLAQLNS